jgi:hypothetical protein
MKVFFLAIFSVIIMFTSNSQSIHFEFNNGTDTDYFIPFVKKISFESNFLKLHYTNGTMFSWHVDSLKLFNFNSSSTSEIYTLNEICNKLNVVLFPNPTNDHLKLSFNHLFNENFTIRIYDVKGVEYLKKDYFDTNLETYLVTIDLSNFPPNQYICLLEFKKTGSISKPFTKL